MREKSLLDSMLQDAAYGAFAFTKGGAELFVTILTLKYQPTYTVQELVSFFFVEKAGEFYPNTRIFWFEMEGSEEAEKARKIYLDSIGSVIKDIVGVPHPKIPEAYLVMSNNLQLLVENLNDLSGGTYSPSNFISYQAKQLGPACINLLYRSTIKRLGLSENDALFYNMQDGDKVLRKAVQKAEGGKICFVPCYDGHHTNLLVFQNKVVTIFDSIGYQGNEGFLKTPSGGFIRAIEAPINKLIASLTALGLQVIINEETRQTTADGCPLFAINDMVNLCNFPGLLSGILQKAERKFGEVYTFPRFPAQMSLDTQRTRSVLNNDPRANDIVIDGPRIGTLKEILTPYYNARGHNLHYMGLINDFMSENESPLGGYGRFAWLTEVKKILPIPSITAIIGEYADILQSDSTITASSMGTAPDKKPNHSVNTILTAIKHFIYRKDIAKLGSVLQQYDIDTSAEHALSPKGFRAASLVLHPDKLGNTEDFAFLVGLREKWEQKIDLQSILESQIRSWQAAIQKTTAAMKVADITVDIVRAYQLPTIENVKNVAVNSLHFYSMYAGSTSVSIALGMLLVGNVYYENGESQQALQQMLSRSFYMAAPIMLAAASPLAAFAYSVAIATYTGYHVASNAHSLYVSMNDEKYELESLSMYRDNYKWLYECTAVELFKTKMEEYSDTIEVMKRSSGNENPGLSIDENTTHDCNDQPSIPIAGQIADELDM